MSEFLYLDVVINKNDEITKEMENNVKLKKKVKHLINILKRVGGG